MPTSLQFGDRVRAVMKYQELSQKELASLTGIPLSTLSNYINNRRQADYAAIRKIAMALNVSADLLLNIPEQEQSFAMEDECGLEFQLGWAKLTRPQQTLLLGIERMLLEENENKENN